MSYHEDVKKELTLKLRELTKAMPSFARDYFRSIEASSSERTRVGYARDLTIFFNYLTDTMDNLLGKDIKDITVEDMRRITSGDIDEFLDYISYYYKGNEELSNGENGKARKLAAIRGLFKYLYKRELITANPAGLVSTPKIHEKNIIKLDPDETARLLDDVETGDKLTEKQLAYHKSSGTRDLAIMTLLLGTGIRVSECVGLDIKDIDFNHNGIKITRKGGNEAMVYFGAEVRKALKDYLEERNQIIALPGHEDALFLSIQKKRLTVRSVEKMVEKYTKGSVSMKHISPHKLRSTYGTSLYRETGDIYLVADVLGHKDVNTTRRHYAQLEDQRRREAAKYIHLRTEDENPQN